MEKLNYFDVEYVVSKYRHTLYSKAFNNTFHLHTYGGCHKKRE